MLLGGVRPLWVIGGPVALSWAFLLAMSGLRLAFSDLGLIATSFIPETEIEMKPRIPTAHDVVVVNNRDKIKVPNLIQKTKSAGFLTRLF